MARLTRAETQERNRAKVLAAAREEFTERGFRDAKIDSIADRAELTRGAVYSNFPGKRALYFAVLAEDAERAPEPVAAGRTADKALGAFARAWLARLPLSADERGPGAELLPEILTDEPARQAFAQLMRLDALLLGLALERLTGAGRMVRVAETALTTLQGASRLAAAAPGFVEPFTIAGACERMAGLDLDDAWSPPHLPYVPPAHAVDAPWSPPPAVDAVTGEAARLDRDGVVAVLGLHRIEAVEEAVRAVPPGETVALALVSGDPDELAPLARLAVAELCGCLRQAFPPEAWPRLQVIHDPAGSIATAAGLPAVGDLTETAVRVRAGRLVARADTRGACHAAATA
ncbi:TetR family transcriptional regulator [Actinomadura sp. DC4]|uniref:TetR/AcrR family transcriptional regulator n=1 Tax=Actinomadura sp. DC4 TaxID=3055069 RepID=UPI0025AF1684|nr:TetR family transcriptional regulator [Actinomadura sp. DC4]MDN3354068.1 TetR family transcriptional regulator [Actinomadura sp. DC4]